MKRLGQPLAPAPGLTKIYFAAIQGDQDPNWQFINGAASATSPCTGQSLYVCLEFIGLPNRYTVRFYINGTVIDVNNVIDYINLEELLVDSSGTAYGERRYYEIPFSVINGNSIAIMVEASGLNGGTASAYLSNINLVRK